MNRYVLLVWNILLTIGLTGLFIRILDLEERLGDFISRTEFNVAYLTRFVGDNSELLEWLHDVVYDIHPYIH